MDIIIAALFPLTWIYPNLIYAGMFEILATCLAAELIVLLALFTLAKRDLPDRRGQLHRDWTLVRWVVLVVLGYQVLDDGVSWYTLLFIAVVLLTADFPLRIAAHEHWLKQLNTDIWILFGVVTGSLVLAMLTARMAVPDVRIPANGIIHDLVINEPWLPQEILCMGTCYFIAKAVLNSYRYLTDKNLVMLRD